MEIAPDQEHQNLTVTNQKLSMNKTELVNQFDSIKVIDATLTEAIKLQTT